jgi:hypothetical protein
MVINQTEYGGLMGRRHQKDPNFNSDVFSGLIGFAGDSLKVIFKRSPDQDQDMNDFIMEKLGAVALLLVVLAVIGGCVFYLYMRYRHY